uniref:CUB domain-containing protein n=1 Tax=Rhabditophanes sp. KR3021 TaxID=114890 RepID=A0AC35UCW8_9BILA
MNYYSGTFTSTNFPYNYDNFENQINIISVPNYQTITLTFNTLQIPQNEYTLFVYDGFNRYSPKLLSLTGQETSTTLTISSTSNVISVYFVPVLSDVKYKGWKISWYASSQYTTPDYYESTISQNSWNTDGPFTTTIVPPSSCPASSYTNPTGTLTSTNYPQNYLNNLDCYYQITLPVGQKIILTINDLLTEKGYDFLRVYDGTSTNNAMIGIYQGQLGNLDANTLVSTSNSLLLWFHTDVSNVFRGWSANYATYISSVKYINTTTGSLATSNLPQNYPKNIDYTYVFRVPMYLQINLQIFTFQCDGTTLTIKDGSSKQSLILDTLTGNVVDSNTNPLQYFSTFNYLSFTFNQQKVLRCGMTSFTQPQGLISSPGFDGYYPNSLDCTIKITLPKNKRIAVTMNLFITEQDKDYLKIYDGKDSSSPFIGTYTGDLSSQLSSLSFTSYSNELTLVFHTNYAINAQGWQLHYETIEPINNIIYYANSGSISSNNFPQNYAAYTTEVYTIQNLYGLPITFNVGFLSLASRSSLAFYEDGNLSGSLIAKLTGSVTSPTIITSRSSNVLVYFAVQTNDTSKGFSLSWISQDNDPTCPRKLYQGQFGQLTSPNWPSNYAKNQDCYYYISVTPGKRIEFDLASFNINPVSDHLSFYDGQDTSGTPFITNKGIIYKSDASATIKSSSNVMTVWFHSDSGNTSPGFSGFYSEIESSHIVKIESTRGTLTSRNYPSNYDTYADEHYLLFSPEAKTINVTLNEVSLQSSYTTLSLYDGPSESYPLLRSYSGHVIINQNDALIQSTQNMITVIFKTEYPITDRGFSFNWAS